MGKTDEGVALCGALWVDYVASDVWREIQEQVSNKCHHQRPTWLEKQKGAIAKQITEDFLQVSL